MNIPVIETQRLTLRGHCATDFDALAAMWSDPLVTRYIGGKPSTPSESWARLLRYSGHWQLLGFGYWAVQLKGTTTLIGDVGFGNWRREIEPPLEGMPESGWVFVPSAHGRGLATEAVKAVLTWGDTHFQSHPTHQTACIVGVENEASLRVANKCGYREVARSEFNGATTVQFRRTAHGG